MRRIATSLSHALHGLDHALRKERNLRLFTIGFVVVILLALIRDISQYEWMALLISGFTFMAIELLNTALERFVDAFDEYRRKIDPATGMHLGLKMTKDIASSASLVSFVAVVIVILMIVADKL